VSDRFDWGPEPELIDVRDEARARPALEALGEQTWRTALDWLYGEALRRPMHTQTYPEARDTFFGPTNRPAPAPMSPSVWTDVLAEFRSRVAPATYNAQHPGSFSYFTPPPLPSSIAGEVLSQWIHQGVDVWHAGPIGTFVEEEVTAWLRDLVGVGCSRAAA
jgi:glutamate/tyrosine decarboxylase-like PLP-dependent enzyme